MPTPPNTHPKQDPEQSQDHSAASVQLVLNPGLAEAIIRYVEEGTVQLPPDEPTRVRVAQAIARLKVATNEQRLHALDFARGYLEAQAAHDDEYSQLDIPANRGDDTD